MWIQRRPAASTTRGWATSTASGSAEPAGSARRSRGRGRGGRLGISVLRLLGAGLPEDVLGRLELEGRVVDVEVVGQAGPEVVEDVAGLRVLGQDDVRGHDVHAARDRPG